MLRQVLAAGLSVVVTGCTIHHVYLFFARPTRFREIVSKRPGLNRWQIAIGYGYMIAAAFGIGYCIYRGVLAGLWWIPRGWVSINDDGEREWIGFTIAATAGLFGAIGIIEAMGKLNAQHIELERLLEQANTRVATLSERDRRPPLR